MSAYQQHQAPQAYPPPGQAYPPQAEGYPPAAYVAPPPPMGYPTKDGQSHQQNPVPVESKSRGEGFWKGCCAGLCCCCLLDWCAF